MIFIIEGHDLYGKTTAARNFGAEFGIPVVTPWADLSDVRPSLISVSRTLQSVVSAVGTHFIFDRFITSELIYGTIFGRDISYVGELLDEWAVVDQLCVLHGGLPEKDLIERFSERGDHLFDLPTILEVRREYERLPSLLPSWMQYVHCVDPASMRLEIADRLRVS